MFWNKNGIYIYTYIYNIIQLNILFIHTFKILKITSLCQNPNVYCLYIHGNLLRKRLIIKQKP